MVISSCKKKKKKKKTNKKGIKIDPSLERKFLGISISLFLLIQIFPRDSKNPSFLPSFLPLPNSAFVSQMRLFVQSRHSPWKKARKTCLRGKFGKSPRIFRVFFPENKRSLGRRRKIGEKSAKRVAMSRSPPWEQLGEERRGGSVWLPGQVFNNGSSCCERTIEENLAFSK